MALNSKTKKQTCVKGKSSALVISIVVHALLLLVAATYVAMEVIERAETKFEGKQISRPKMKLKKLQMPVKLETKIKQQAPKLSQRVTADTKLNTKAMDFKMPDVAGFGGSGMGNSLADDGLGIGSLGFATTQLNVFGLKSSGEKVLFILSVDDGMVRDNMGGIPAYTIIKQELVRLLNSLPPTTLFNLVLYHRWHAEAFSKELLPATDKNLKDLEAWIAPLNTSKTKSGFKSMKKEGYAIEFIPCIPIGNWQPGLLSTISYAVEKSADSVFWLGESEWVEDLHRDEYANYKKGKPLTHSKGWSDEMLFGRDLSSFGEERWDKLLKEANRKLEQENKERLAAGRPVRVVGGGEVGMISTYNPGMQMPPKLSAGLAYKYKPSDVIEYMENAAKKTGTADRRSVSIGLKKQKMTFNVIHFVPAEDDAPNLEILRQVARKNNGGYKSVKGLKAIRSSVTGR